MALPSSGRNRAAVPPCREMLCCSRRKRVPELLFEVDNRTESADALTAKFDRSSPLLPPKDYEPPITHQGREIPVWRPPA
ncbi:hypothetical protein ACIOKD_36420 [Streptomyces sp. NPDC087844]|uniref:hypothetical protein n=1 Tax=Streptomyces sp. NPDC087844 TaxID=3365805 RepID=UPI003808878D